MGITLELLMTFSKKDLPNGLKNDQRMESICSLIKLLHQKSFYIR
jgi:hypothetical protein